MLVGGPTTSSEQPGSNEVCIAYYCSYVLAGIVVLTGL